MTDNLLLKNIFASPWIYDSVKSEYSLTINGTVVAIIDSNGNLKIKGRVLQF